MRVSKIELIAVVSLIPATIVSYIFVKPLIQGRTAESDWIYWTTQSGAYTKIRDVIPLEVIGELLIAALVVYILAYKRRMLWEQLASMPIPEWISLSWVSRIAEKYFTDNYKMQREALSFIPNSLSPEERTLVDIGCGGAAYLDKLDSFHKTGVDVNPRRLRLASKHCDKVIQWDFSTGLDGMQASVALCFEVIEHLTKEQGYKLLEDLERFPTVILSTPYKWVEVNRKSNEAHLSFWTPDELESFGYIQVGCGHIPPSNIYLKRRLE